MHMADTFYRRNLPHWQPPGATFFITWRLFGSLPREALDRLEANKLLLEREIARADATQDERKIHHFKKQFALYDSLLDYAQDGPMWLKEDRLAAVVQTALLEGYRDQYTLWAYVVMANHVHVFLTPSVVAWTSVRAGSDDGKPAYIPLSQITRSLKGSTAREANKLLDRTGQPFWQDESYDHWARDDDEFSRIIAYIENNPVKAGLVLKPEDWQWSSAAERKRRGIVERVPLS
jgi:REP element-mobilizing transposase RayT